MKLAILLLSIIIGNVTCRMATISWFTKTETRSLIDLGPDDDISSLGEFHFSNSLPIKFIIHGFNDDATTWVDEMKNEILKAEDANVFAVDWSVGAKFQLYTVAKDNTLIVGQDIADLCIYLERNGADLQNVHLIGHSLGAMIAGYAGFLLNGRIGRISGLDPASLFYVNIDKKFKLDATDANFVDVIHTDSSEITGMGLREASGHVDFYPNDGKDMPGCPPNRVKAFSTVFSLATSGFKEAVDTVSCSHIFVHRVFTDSIRNRECNYQAYRCDNYRKFSAGKCLSCPSVGCNTMGYWASKEKQLGTVFLNTKSVREESNYCKYHYSVDLTQAFQIGFPTVFRGNLEIKLKNDDKTVRFGKNNFRLNKFSSTKLLFDSDSLIKDVRKATASFKTNGFFPRSKYFSKFGLVIGGIQQIDFCPLRRKSITFEECF